MASKFKSFSIFGYSVNLAKREPKKGANSTSEKKRATGAIRKQPKREVSYQIADIKSAIQMALNSDEPNRFKLLDIYKYVMRDGRLKSQLRDAKTEVLSEPFLIYMNGKPDKEASKRLEKRWMRHLIEYIVESEFYGYSVCELNWNQERTDVASVVLIEREHVSIERQQILIEASINGPTLPYGEIMWDIDLLEFGKRNDLGSLLEASYNVIWKLYSRSDWSRASEKFGMPILAVEAETTDDKELDDIENRAANFGADGYIVTQAGDKVNIIERTGQRMHDIYFDNIKFCNEEISILINGQTATTDQKSFVGSAEVQERKMEGITASRLQMVVDEFNEKVVPYLIYKGILSEGHTLNYPELIRIKERRLAGKSLSSDAKPAPKEDKDEPTSDPKTKENKDA